MSNEADVARGDKEGPSEMDRTDKGPGPRATARYLSVRVGHGLRVHLKAQRATITLCGLGSELLGGRITLTAEAPTCPACAHFVKHPQAGA